MSRVTAPTVGGTRVSPGRRALDVAVSLTALMALLPILLVLAVLVRCTSRGPVLFRQVRVGAGGRPFVMLKFRSMSVGALGGPQVTTQTDQRITALGRVLRRSSLDELPQLVNVLRGQMTLVGPRPETVDLAARYPDDCRWVLQHAPGLTGPCQIRLRDREALPPEAVDAEDYYLSVLVPRRVALDMTFLGRPTVTATMAVLLETFGYLVGRRPAGLDV
ncbi:MAG TPA: sugar transferase [Actinomycetes bacterium]|jgi:lipopolysaccharide/colanic/teichoic acid biosynthesis glycosyltransferase|nr:sugar transferase [Actinomycetes bacterium]